MFVGFQQCQVPYYPQFSAPTQPISSIPVAWPNHAIFMLGADIQLVSTRDAQPGSEHLLPPDVYLCFSLPVPILHSYLWRPTAEEVSVHFFGYL